MRRVAALARPPGSVIRRWFQVATRLQTLLEGTPQRLQLLNRHDPRHPGHTIAAKGGEYVPVAALGVVVLAVGPSTPEGPTVEDGASCATPDRRAAPSQRRADLVVQPP